MLSLYGKLPTAGDFLSVEIPRPLLRPLEDWLSASVATSRDNVEGDWTEIFDKAPVWCFWIGENVLGRRMAGVLRTSRDKVGRRFPVVLFTSSEDRNAVAEAPVLDSDWQFYRDLGEELTYLAGLAPDEISERLKAAGGPAGGLGEPITDPEPSASFWAVAPEPGETGWQSMIEDAASVDHGQATANRSYWWTPEGAGSHAALFSTQGMPDPHVFAWFLTGLGEQGFANQDE